MSIASALLAFTVAAALLTITPGLDTAMVLRTATLEGSRRAAWAALGIGVGCVMWGGAVALGVGALLLASEVAFTALRMGGAAYLAFLGLRMLLRPRTAVLDTVDAGREPPGALAAFTQAPFSRGFVTNALNPKVGVFYVTLLPQFVPDGVPVAAFTFLLAAVHVVLGLVWSAALIAAAAPLGRALRKPAVVRALDRATGIVFLAFGAKLALDR